MTAIRIDLTEEQKNAIQPLFAQLQADADAGRPLGAIVAQIYAGQARVVLMSYARATEFNRAAEGL